MFLSGQHIVLVAKAGAFAYLTDDGLRSLLIEQSMAKKINIKKLKQIPKKVKLVPIHPGELLQDELNARKISQSALAAHIKVPQSKINDICRGRRGISAEMAVKIGRALGTSHEIWFNLQKDYELSCLDKSKFSDIKPIAA